MTNSLLQRDCLSRADRQNCHQRNSLENEIISIARRPGLGGVPRPTEHGCGLQRWVPRLWGGDSLPGALKEGGSVLAIILLVAVVPCAWFSGIRSSRRLPH